MILYNGQQESAAPQIHSKEVFRPFAIARAATFEACRNQYDVLHVNMQDFLSRTHRVEALLGRFRRALLRELLQAYPDVDYFDRTDLVEVLAPGAFAPYTGFTADEVESLCEHYHMDFTLAKQWYDGYAFPDAVEIYNPRSVVTAMLQHRFGTYWNQTETFEALRVYIDLNLDGLRDAIIRLLAGGSLKINTGTFGNDMTTFHTADDVLTLLVHLGYLAYDEEQGEVRVANREVMLEFISAVSVSGWEEVARSIKAERQSSIRLRDRHA